MATPTLPETQPTVATDVVADRLAALRDAVAGQQLEGLEPSPAVIAALQQVAHSELTVDEVVAEIHARIARGEV